MWPKATASPMAKGPAAFASGLLSVFFVIWLLHSQRGFTCLDRTLHSPPKRARNPERTQNQNLEGRSGYRLGWWCPGLVRAIFQAKEPKKI